MKKGWEYKKLGDVCDTSSGGTPSKNHLEYYEGGTIPWLRSGEVAQGLIYNTELYITESGLNNSSAKLFPVDTVVLAMYGATVGQVGLLKKEMATNQAICGIFPNKRFNPIFLLYSLKAKRPLFLKDAVGGAQPNISQSIIKNTIIPIPPIAEQGYIVKELNLLTSIIDKKKAQLKEYDQLSQSIFYDMFGDPVTNEKGWEVKKLSDVSLEKLSYGSGASAIPYNESVRYIRITDINENGELNGDMVSPNVYDEKYLLDEGDILFARSGATVGKTYCHKSKYGKCMYAGYLIRLVPNKDIVEPSYVFGYTKTSYYMGFVQKAQNAVAQPNINAKQYGSLLICIPPLSLQQSFAEKIEAIEKQKALIQQSITETETLFNSRMDYYFN
ncbi:MAG: restriction endonuclease subunit S [Prevotella sp.]|nr:restriction endonuclease subunit S [Prevotella sp.]